MKEQGKLPDLQQAVVAQDEREGRADEWNCELENRGLAKAF